MVNLAFGISSFQLFSNSRQDRVNALTCVAGALLQVQRACALQRVRNAPNALLRALFCAHYQLLIKNDKLVSCVRIVHLFF